MFIELVSGEPRPLGWGRVKRLNIYDEMARYTPRRTDEHGLEFYDAHGNVELGPVFHKAYMYEIEGNNAPWTKSANPADPETIYNRFILEIGDLKLMPEPFLQFWTTQRNRIVTARAAIADDADGLRRRQYALGAAAAAAANNTPTPSPCSILKPSTWCRRRGGKRNTAKKIRKNKKYTRKSILRHRKHRR